MGEETEHATTEDVKLAKANSWKEWAGVVTAVIALIASLIGGKVSVDNQDQIDETQKLVNELNDRYSKIDTIAANFMLNYVKPAPNISDSNYYRIGGTYTGDLAHLDGNQIRLFINDGNLFYPIFRPAVVAANHTWFHHYTRIKLKGKSIFLLVALCNKQTSSELDEWNSQTNGRGIQGLPEGFYVLNTLELENLNGEVKEVSKQEK